MDLPHSQEQEFEIYTKGPFWAIFTQFGQNKNFHQRSVSLTFSPLWTSNSKVSEKNIKQFTSNDHLKNPVIWLVESFAPKNSRTRFFLDMSMVFSDFLQYGAHFRTFAAKANDQIMKYTKRPFLPLDKTRIFLKNLVDSLFHLYVLWRILQSHWSRASSLKTREPYFS